MSKRNQTFVSFGVLAVIFVGFGIVLGSSFFTASTSTPMFSAGVIKYTSDVCVDIVRADGTSEHVECRNNPNFFSAAGRNAVMDLVGGGGNNTGGVAGHGGLTTFRRIALCNGSNSVQGIQCYTDSGLTNQTGTFLKVADPGNWSITAQFTATADSKHVNSTALLNGTADPTSTIYFAGNNFTDVTLNTNDIITIRWNISIQ